MCAYICICSQYIFTYVYIHDIELYISSYYSSKYILIDRSFSLSQVIPYYFPCSMRPILAILPPAHRQISLPRCFQRQAALLLQKT